MNKKLVKTRSSRLDTVEAMMEMGIVCLCYKRNCENCSGGGAWSASEGYNRMHDYNFDKHPIQ